MRAPLLILTHKITPLLRQVRAPSIVQRSTAAFVLRIAGVGFSFLASMLFARSLGIEQYGVFVYWMTAAGMAVTFLSLGTPGVITRELAAARGANDPAMRARVIRYGLVLTGLSALLITGIGFAVSIFGAASKDQHFWEGIPFLAFAAGAVGVATAFGNAFLLGFERVMASLLLGVVPSAGMAAGAALLWWGGAANAEAAMVVALLAATLSVFAATIAVAKLVPRSERDPARERLARTEGTAWLTLGIVLAINQFLTNAMTQVDILMLGWLATSEATAHYHAASRVSYVTAFFFGSIAAVIAPTIARLYAAGQYNELVKSVQSSSLIAFIGTIIVSLAVLAFGDYILMLFGKRFLEADRVMLVLILTWVLHAAFGLNHTILTMTGRARIGVFALGAAAACNIGLNFILIPLWGAEGAAISSLVSTLAFSLVEWAIVRRALGSAFDIFSLMKDRILNYV